MPKPATIRDVAQRAGVSLATVSRALNGSSLVNEETKRRVVAVAEELDFAPSQSARRLSLGKTQTITVIVSFLTRPQAAERLRGIDASLADSEFDLVIYNVETIEKKISTSSRCRCASEPMASSSCPLPPPEEQVLRLQRSDVPIVFINRTRDTAAFPRVLGDDVAGGVLATEHLLELGHRRIGFVGDAFDNPYGFTSSRDRFAGFERALARAGVDGRPDRVALGAHGRYEARDLASRMLSLPDRPTAIFAASDTQAQAVLAAAQDLGLHVPDDLSVIGYDDIEACDFVGLTTVRQYLFESGREGAQLLMSEIVERAAIPPAVDIQPEIVRRRTTAPRKEGGGEQ